MILKYSIQYTYCTWENFGVEKIGGFGEYNAIHQRFTCLLLPFVIGYTYTHSSFTNMLPFNF